MYRAGRRQPIAAVRGMKNPLREAANSPQLWNEETDPIRPVTRTSGVVAVLSLCYSSEHIVVFRDALNLVALGSSLRVPQTCALRIPLRRSSQRWWRKPDRLLRGLSSGAYPCVPRPASRRVLKRMRTPEIAAIAARSTGAKTESKCLSSRSQRSAAEQTKKKHGGCVTAGVALPNSDSAFRPCPLLCSLERRGSPRWTRVHAAHAAHVGAAQVRGIRPALQPARSLLCPRR